MNLNASVIDRQIFSDPTSDLYKSLGFKDYKRDIILYFKESKNLNGVVGNNLVTKVNSMIINYSIVDDPVFKCRVIVKTNYICDIEFPNNISLERIKRNINSFVSTASVVPIYAFSNIYVIGKNYCDDLGLSMTNLRMAYRTDNVNVINISKLEKTDFILYKRLIYNRYEPRCYNWYDTSVNKLPRLRNIPIEELQDDHTHIICNIHGDEDVQVYLNNNRQTGIYINKKIIAISEALSNLFNKYLFINIENFELIYSSKDGFNLKNVRFFMDFRDDLKKHIIQMIGESINKWIEECLKTKLAGSEYYVVISINNQFAIVDLNLINENKRFVITKPIYKLYGEFVLTKEVLENNKNFANINRLSKINGRGELLLYRYSDKEMDKYISTEEKLQLIFQEICKFKRANGIGMDDKPKCLGNDSFQSNQKP